MARDQSQQSYASAFGQALDEQLAKRSMRPADLARAAGVSPGYVSRLMNGAKVSPEWAQTAAEALGATEEERKRLHAAAAVSWGYQLDLTKPK